VVLSDGKADLGVDLKPTVFIREDDIRWFEGILKGQQDLSMVDTFMVIRVFGPSESEMPDVDIVLKGTGLQVIYFVFLHHVELAEDALSIDVLA
jgi:hypothetical protein